MNRFGRRSMLKCMVAAGAMPAFNISCGDWGRTLLNRAGLAGGCAVANARARHPYRKGWEIA